MLRPRAVAVLVPLLLCAGCGKDGPPKVPEPRGPLPSPAVAVRQLGSAAEVEAGVPGTRGESADQALARAELLRVDFPPGTTPPADPGAFERRGTEVASVLGPFEPAARLTLRDGSLPDLGPPAGRLVRYAVRFRDARGRPSPLALAPDLVLAAAPGAPASVRAESVPEGVRVSWQAPEGGAPEGYLVYRGAGDGPLQGPLQRTPVKETSFLDDSVVLGTRYRYVVRALAAPGDPPRESLGSEPALVTALDRFAPVPPADLVAVREGSAVRLFWTPGTEADLAGYRVERRVGDGSFEPVAEGVTQAQWLDPSPPAGVLAYRVLAVDLADPPNLSPPSEPAEVAAP